MQGAELTEEKKNNNNQAVDLTVGEPRKAIVKFTMPFLFGNVFQLFYSWTDAIVIGQNAPLQLGALSACMPVVNLLITVLMGFLAGAMVVLGQYFGKNDIKNLRLCYTTILCVLMIIIVTLMIAGTLLSMPLLRLLNVSESQIGYANTYLVYYFLGIGFMGMYNCFAQVLRAMGNSKVPLYVLIVCVVLNIGLDILFVIPLEMDIAGVALGTMIAQALSSVILFVYIQKKVSIIRLGRKDIKFDKRILRSILRVALPSTIQQACACIGFMYINALVNQKGNDYAISTGTTDQGNVYTTAFGLGNRIDELMNMVMNSFGMALTSFAAQNKGKGEIDRIKIGYKITLALTAAFMIGFGALILIFREQLIGVFMRLDGEVSNIDIAKVKEITYVFLEIVVPCYILMAIMVLTTSVLRGAGDAKTAMSVNLFSLIIRALSATILTASFIVDPYWAAYGIFWASPIGWLAGAVWGIARYSRGKWKGVNIFLEDGNETGSSPQEGENT